MGWDFPTAEPARDCTALLTDCRWQQLCRPHSKAAPTDSRESLAPALFTHTIFSWLWPNFHNMTTARWHSVAETIIPEKTNFRKTGEFILVMLNGASDQVCGITVLISKTYTIFCTNNLATDHYSTNIMLTKTLHSQINLNTPKCNYCIRIKFSIFLPTLVSSKALNNYFYSINTFCTYILAAKNGTVAYMNKKNIYIFQNVISCIKFTNLITVTCNWQLSTLAMNTDFKKKSKTGGRFA